MLVLTRRVGEALVIDSGIRVTVLAINGTKVRLGFEAPPKVSILRGEVARREAEARAAFGAPAAGQQPVGGAI
jgi:carbon storage regulator CsrA